MATMILSCSRGQQAVKTKPAADSLVNATYDNDSYERVITLCDSLQQSGDVTPFHATYYRGLAYIRLNMVRKAENEFKQVQALKPADHQDSIDYYMCLARIVEIHSVQEDNEGVMKIGLPVMEAMNRMAVGGNERSVHFILMVLTQCLGQSQMRLGMMDEAGKWFDQSLLHAQAIHEAEQSWESLFYMIVLSSNIIDQYLRKKDYASAEKWIHREDSLVAVAAARQDAPPGHVQSTMDVVHLNQAIIRIGQNKPKEAEEAFAKYQASQTSHTNAGRIDAAKYLLKAGRYAEAADAYSCLDGFFAERGIDPKLDNMEELAEKFTANKMAGRRDSAIAVATYAFDYLGNALTLQRKSDAAELATVYETQQKDAEIAQQQVALSQQRWISTLAALVLLTAFFIIYTLNRRHAQKRLSAAHEKLEIAHNELQTAYDQLEATTAAKERIESELRIARDIQMSMVPKDFPVYEGLDMYAEMTPAKEVGGDLYGYVLHDDRLYFCVGDVSGKGVPASLFIAQSARLFRTLATEGLSPVDIAVRMNRELAENNDCCMFVTMFIGLLHLETGRLDYCNCGHNPPVIDGQFLPMHHVNQPLGLWEDDSFEGETIDDIRGRQLLVYTDGLNEAENQHGQLLGDDRLLQLMADTASLDAREVIDMLKASVSEHRAGAEPNDDLTLMCLRLS